MKSLLDMNLFKNKNQNRNLAKNAGNFKNLKEKITNHLDNTCDKNLKIFDAQWYLTTYPDVKAAEVDPFEHYIEIGWKEGRSPSPLFNTTVYLEQEPGFKEKLLASNIDPLYHYHLFGFKEKRTIFFNNLTNEFKSYYPSSGIKYFNSIESIKIKNSCAAFIHAYYIDIAESLIESCLIKGIAVYVAFIENTDYSKLIDKFGDNINYKIFENRGRDIAPFLLGFTNELKKYKYAVHLHTKKSLHYGVERSDWLGYCVESLLGNISFIERIFEEQKDVAIVFPEPPDFIKQKMNWGYNYNRVFKLMEMLGHELKKTDIIDFPAGSMFWFKVNDLLPIFNLKISKYLFEYENGQVDGTLAHAIERLFGIYSLHIGKKLIPVRLKDTKYFKFEKRIDKSSIMMEEHHNKGMETYSKALKYFYPELTPITFKSSTNVKQRLNLLVPTINKEHVFGGISTAIKFFQNLGKELNCDLRIISTDSVTLSTTLTDYDNYSNYSLTFFNDDDTHQVLSIVPRSLGDMVVRESDIFIATAWWTAHHLFEIERFQTKYYNRQNNHIYFVQDYEPHFYAWSSKSQLADKTYDNQWIKVYNTQLLFDYFEQRNKLVGENYVLKPTLNSSIKSELLSLNGTKKEKIILIYGRPSAERNCNEVLLEAFSILKDQWEDYSKWKIISLGEDYEHELLSELNIKVLGKVSLEEYSKLLAQASIGISLMVSPHPSYPPFEMLAAGLHTYTNKYDNKDNNSITSNLISFGNVDALEIKNYIVDSASHYKESIYYDASLAEKISFGDGELMDDIIIKIKQGIKL